MIKNVIANSNNQSLYLHSTSCAKLAELYFNSYFKPNDELKERVIFSALFHDIGKVTSLFLDQMNKSVKHKVFPHHHEIGYAFLLNKLQYEDEKPILDSIYYSHATPRYKDKDKTLKEFYYYSNSKEILDFLSDSDKELLEQAYTEFLSYYDWQYINFKNRKVNTYKDIPKYIDWNYEKVEETLIVRSILHTVDRIVSKETVEQLEVNDEFFQFNNYLNTKIDTSSFYVSKEYSERFNSTQKPIIDSIGKKKSIVIKAPTGYGKTLMGMYWAVKNKSKIIWVCPDNSTCDAIYNNIIQELNNISVKLSVELVYGSRKQKCTNQYEGMFESDIVITNIDNYLFPSYKTHMLDKSAYIFTRNVIFDEYHALQETPSYYKFFMSIMKIRAFQTDQKTLLLSATPNIHHKIINDYYDETSMEENDYIYALPDDSSHFKSLNTTTFNYSFEDIDINYTPKPEIGDIYFFNLVKDVQYHYMNSDFKILYHSRYSDEDKEKLREKMYSMFAKHTKGNIKDNAISSFVGEKAMDISFRNMYSTLFTFESELQRLGRVSRWSEYDTANVTVLIKNFDNDASEKWLWIRKSDKEIFRITKDFMMNNIKGNVKYDELYTLYNKFLTENEDILRNYFNEVEISGERKFDNIKFFHYVNEDKPISGKTLRSNSDSYNYYVLDSENNFIGINASSDDYFIDNIPSSIYRKNSKVLKKFMEEIGGKKLERYLTKRLKEGILDEDIKDWINKSKNKEYPFLDLFHDYYEITDTCTGIGLNFKGI